MTHRFPIKEIARQSGLGTATIDRVLNGRAHVSAKTKARVATALEELCGQERQLSAKGRNLFFDVVVESPARFCREVKEAAERVLPQIGPAACRLRFLMQDTMTADDIITALARIAKRGSHGVCIKARDIPEIGAAVDRLVDAGIPVVTLVTDLTGTQRRAYVGLDNHSAGRTAAYLISKTVGTSRGTILTSKSNDHFQGEGERETAFRANLAQLCPNLRILNADGGAGVHYETARLMEQIADSITDLRGVYSMGGGNKTILDVLHQHHLNPDIYVAHDLDAENRDLIETGAIDYILLHDLDRDLANVFCTLLHHHKLVAEEPDMLMSSVQVVTPANIPTKTGGAV